MYVVYLKHGIADLGKSKKHIWEVVNIFTEYNTYRTEDIECVKLKNIINDEGFTTDIRNVVEISDLVRKNLFKEEYINPASYKKYLKILSDDIKDLAEQKDQTEKEIQAKKAKEISVENKVKKVMNTNVDAAKVAASITAGKALNKVVASKVTPQLPLMVKGYADTVFGRVVLANVADFAVKQFMPYNQKANLASKAMMEAAMFELMDSFDFESIVNEIVNSVELPATE